MSRNERARAYFGLLEDLENLLARRVDLVKIGAVRNPHLRREIEEHQVILSDALSGPLTQNW
jgi:predicted nucleotidyltransferase